MQVSALFTCDAGPCEIPSALGFGDTSCPVHVNCPYGSKYFCPSSPIQLCFCQKQRIPGHLVFTSSTANTGLCSIEMKITQIYSP